MENEVKEEKKPVFKVEANMRFIFAPTGRIYDPGNIFECSKADQEYLVNNKLCKAAKPDAEVSETEQDKQEAIAAGNSTEEKKIEALSVIRKIQEEKPAKVKTTKPKK